MQCAEEGCSAACKTGSHRWGKVKAQEAGWYFRKDGNKAWCPKHTPEWVAYWRARKKAKE